MRKFVLAALALALSVGLTLAGEVTFVSFDAAKNELKVKEGDAEKTYKVTDKTAFKNGEKDAKRENALTRLGKMKAKTKFEVTASNDEVTEVKFIPAKKK